MNALPTPPRAAQDTRAESTGCETARHRRPSRNLVVRLAVAITPLIASIVIAAPAMAWPEIGG